MSDKNPEKYEGHGDNWKAVGDFDEEDILAMARSTIQYGDPKVRRVGEFVGMIAEEPPIRAMALLHVNGESEENELYSFYPFFEIHNPVDVQVDKIEEWRNKGEAVIKGSVGGMPISFFDPLYFVNKKEYKLGHTYQFNLIGLAHSFTKRTEDLEIIPEEGPRKGETFHTRWMTYYGDSDEFGGEFSFVHPFTSFDGAVDAFGSQFFRFPFHMNFAMHDSPTFSFPLYVRQELLGDTQFQLNDSVMGSGWLQGYLVDSFKDKEWFA